MFSSSSCCWWWCSCFACAAAAAATAVVVDAVLFPFWNGVSAKNTMYGPTAGPMHGQGYRTHTRTNAQNATDKRLRSILLRFDLNELTMGIAIWLRARRVRYESDKRESAYERGASPRATVEFNAMTGRHIHDTRKKHSINKIVCTNDPHSFGLWFNATCRAIRNAQKKN